ncbi:hypothetical protein ID866_6479 [Astraeus odoratus]|nr:hypothetical protein ID866_6479 [Astraeus odoratus]
MAYKTATGATIDVFDHNQQLSISENQYNNLQILSILIGDQSYDLSPNAQIYPRASPNEQIFLVINSIDLASEVDFRLGYTFIQRYYVVFNSSSSQIGFASHLHTDSTTN